MFERAIGGGPFGLAESFGHERTGPQRPQEKGAGQHLRAEKGDVIGIGLFGLHQAVAVRVPGADGVIQRSPVWGQSRQRNSPSPESLHSLNNRKIVPSWPSVAAVSSSFASGKIWRARKFIRPLPSVSKRKSLSRIFRSSDGKRKAAVCA